MREQARRGVQFATSKDLTEQLAAMANDPAIRSELAIIDQEFSFPAQPVGRLSDEKMREVEAVVHYCLGL